MDTNHIPPESPKPGPNKMSFHRPAGPLGNKPATPPLLQPRPLSALPSQAQTNPVAPPPAPQGVGRQPAGMQKPAPLPVPQGIGRQPAGMQKPVPSPAPQGVGRQPAGMQKPTAGKGVITSARPNPMGGDFEAFRQQKLRQKQVEEASGNRAESHRHKRQEGMSGSGEQYQDQKLAKAVSEGLRHDDDEYIKAYKDQRVADISKQKFATDGQGKQLQDHRLGEGIQGNLDFSAGQGAKYQDHRLGKGFAKEQPDDVQFDDANG